MVRYLYAGTPGDYLAKDGRPVPAETVVVSTAGTDASIITDITTGTVGTVAAGVVTADSRGQFSFRGPDGFAGDLFVRAQDGGPWLRATGPDNDALAGAYARVLTPQAYGAVGDGVADDTAALAALAAAVPASGGQVYFPPGTYRVSSLAEGAALMSFVGKRNLIIDAAAATIDNPTSYVVDTITPMFRLDGCSNVRISLGEYIGYTLPSPSTDLGYKGATLVQAFNATDGVTVDAKVTNARYGVQTGTYSDPTTGQCKNFDVRLRGSMVGYGIAAYYADGIRHDLDIDGVHRVAYIAGCHDVRGVARWRDQYIAPIAYLLTDALTSGTDAAAQVAPPANPTTSRGCANVDVTVIDKGSTVFQNSSVCAGIALSRVDPCRFENIRVRVHVVGDDTVSTRVGGFHLLSSGVPATWSRYAYNWEPTVELDNIVVSGVVDHSAQTLPGNATGELYIYTKDDAGEGSGKYATVRALAVTELTILKSSAVSPRPVFVVAREPAVPVRLRGVNAPGLTLSLVTSTSVPTQIDGCVFDRIDIWGSVASLVSLGAGCKVNALTGPFAVRSGPDTLGIGGAGGVMMQKETTLTLSGASVSWAAAVPAGALLLGVQGRVQAAITGASGYQVGVGGDVARFADSADLAVGATFGPSSQAATETSPRWYAAATALVVTAKTANFTAGSLRLILTYLTFTAPTS